MANAVRGLCNWVCNLDLTPNPRLGSLSCRAGTAGGAGTPILHAASPWRLYLEVGHAYGYETHARGPSRCFSTSLAPRRAARRRRDSAYHTSVRRSSDCAVVVTAEGASSVARAVPSDSVSCMLAAPRVPTDRFKGGVSAQGESPAPRSWKRRAARSRRVVRRSLQPTRDKYRTQISSNPWPIRGRWQICSEAGGCIFRRKGRDSHLAKGPATGAGSGTRAGIGFGIPLTGGHHTYERMLPRFFCKCFFRWEFIFVRHYVRMWFTSSTIVGLDRYSRGASYSGTRGFKPIESLRGYTGCL